MMFAIKNSIAAFSAILFLLLLCFFTSDVSFIATEFGSVVFNLDYLFSLSIIEAFIEYWKWYVINFKAIPYDYNHYLPIRLILLSVTPITLITVLIIIFWDWIYEHRPFKEEEALHGDARWAEESD